MTAEDFCNLLQGKGATVSDGWVQDFCTYKIVAINSLSIPATPQFEKSEGKETETALNFYQAKWHKTCRIKSNKGIFCNQTGS